jgi:hypothetical protein
MAKTALLLALVFASCKLGPFPDEPVQKPEAPQPSGWGGWVGKGKADAGVTDAEAPAQRDQ